MARLAIAALILAGSASAQSLNLRFTDWTPPPASSYGAAIGQVGVWNALESPVFGPNSNPAVDLAGGPTAVSVAHSGCDAFACTVSGYGTDVQALFAGALNGDCFADPSSTTLHGLAPGKYVLTAYASPCHVQFPPMEVLLSDHSYYVVADLGGDYTGSFDSMDLGSFAFDVNAGVSVSFVSLSQGYLAALQVTKVEAPATYCTSKVNSQGCAARIAAVGNAASMSGAAPFHVLASDVLDGVPGLCFYGPGAATSPFFGGTLCVDSPVTRTAGQFSGGDGTPCSGTFDLDVNAWLATQPAPKVYAGMRLHAQYWYRDPADPFGAATSDAVSFHVLP